jgi:ubiquitin carboxyl-terminal hydrolase 22/27/51
LRGIQNLGNTCYMSSILQSFIHNPLVRNHYLADTHQTSTCTRATCIHCTISGVFSSMYSPQDPFTPYGPTDFISTVFKSSALFAGADQQDSHEFLIFLLNAMHSHHTGTPGDERMCKCLAHQVFGGESQSSVRCEGCGKTNVTREMMFDIGLQIREKDRAANGKSAAVNGSSAKGSPVSPSSSGGSSSDATATAAEMSTTHSIQDCLDKYGRFPGGGLMRRYTSLEHLDQSQYTCSNCSNSTGATKQMSIKVLPNVLCIQLKVINLPVYPHPNVGSASMVDRQK